MDYSWLLTTNPMLRGGKNALSRIVDVSPLLCSKLDTYYDSPFDKAAGTVTQEVQPDSSEPWELDKSAWRVDPALYNHNAR
jgi:hypothetical protein